MLVLVLSGAVLVIEFRVVLSKPRRCSALMVGQSCSVRARLWTVDERGFEQEHEHRFAEQEQEGAKAVYVVIPSWVPRLLLSNC